VPLRRQPPAA